MSPWASHVASLGPERRTAPIRVTWRRERGRRRKRRVYRWTSASPPRQQRPVAKRIPPFSAKRLTRAAGSRAFQQVSNRSARPRSASRSSGRSRAAGPSNRGGRGRTGTGGLRPRRRLRSPERNDLSWNLSTAPPLRPGLRKDGACGPRNQAAVSPCRRHQALLQKPGQPCGYCFETNLTPPAPGGRPRFGGRERRRGQGRRRRRPRGRPGPLPCSRRRRAGSRAPSAPCARA